MFINQFYIAAGGSWAVRALDLQFGGFKVKSLPPQPLSPHDVMVAILLFQNNETAAMLVSQTNPVGFEVFSYVNSFFCSNKFDR